jgi:ankyrin repeat protein
VKNNIFLLLSLLILQSSHVLFAPNATKRAQKKVRRATRKLIKLVDYQNDDAAAEKIPELIAQGANINANVHRALRTPLMNAARYHMPKTMELLLKKGAQVSFTNRFNFTALWEATNEGSPDTFSMLLEAGADPEKELRGITKYLFTAQTVNELKEVINNHKKKHPELPKNYGDFVNRLIT